MDLLLHLDSVVNRTLVFKARNSVHFLVGAKCYPIKCWTDRAFIIVFFKLHGKFILVYNKEEG